MDAIKSRVNVHNRFDISVMDKEGYVKQRAYAENIILDQAWGTILSNVDWFDQIYYGTGSGAISAGRTTLFTPLGKKLATNSIFTDNIDDNYFSQRQEISILETEYIGATLTEVGVGTSTTLCTHALLMDMNGNPISIVKTETDIIIISATIYVKPATSHSYDSAIDFVWNGAKNNALLRHLLGRRLLASDGSPFNGFNVFAKIGRGTMVDGADIYTSPVSQMTIDVINKKVSWSHRVPAASANVNGLGRYILYSQVGSIMGTYSTKAILGRLTSNSVTQSAITEQIGIGDGVTKDFKTTFPFVQNGATVSVDGVIFAPTIDYGVFDANDISGYMRNLTYKHMPDKEFLGNTLSQSAPILILENSMFSITGVTHFVGNRFTVEASSNLTDWVLIITSGTSEGNNSYAVPLAYKNFRYFRISILGNSPAGGILSINNSDLASLKNVHFETAPATGATISATYVSNMAEKDANHVLDMAVEIYLGEYTG